ncbi:hypothetical protein ACP70R_050349 [Stipagrostis hirtigluma subsp. patula]
MPDYHRFMVVLEDDESATCFWHADSEHIHCCTTGAMFYLQENLWRYASPVGTEWESIDKIHEFNWDFKNLEKALEEGGELYGKTVYLFLNPEPQLLDVNGELKMVLVPIVVAVDCPFPPSDKIGIDYAQTGIQEIVPMENMKMAWMPYVPFEDRDYMSLNPPEDEDGTDIRVTYPLESPLEPPQSRAMGTPPDLPLLIIFDFPVGYDDYEVCKDFQLFYSDVLPTMLLGMQAGYPHIPHAAYFLRDLADMLVDQGVPEDEREKLEEFLKEKVKQRKIELKQAEEARKKAIEDMHRKQREAFQNIKFYKFYPVKTPDTPDVPKSGYINRYYRMAHYVM